MRTERLLPEEAAKLFTDENFLTSSIVLLGGSVVRGEATETSDLDIVVVDDRVDQAYRESIIAHDWPIEVFVHNRETIYQFFEKDCERARPSLPRMVAEGKVIKDDGSSKLLKEHALRLLLDGPPEWNESTIGLKRYFLTDLLDDFIGSVLHAESLFIAGALATALHEFVLRTNRMWIGSSKWIVRALNDFDQNFADEFVNCFDCYYRTGDKEPVIKLVDLVLQPYGGRLFHGFSLGK
ncbi:nucleotidyltransferase domain-containing protein [Rossellomorea aquimaris]|uniref:nucleotidyltransferase domain-containing protein n=1 Tax=Rossellomorea aquimaris TaxID=189382 RepID=UPI001CD69735|nr:nucleotidyltransferase domain-containing protein [Rossellomorea aquimaris]MCA1053783.1 nucleotidyltransferase domain-containing protein [Rossellomorea aquimaris]